MLEPNASQHHYGGASISSIPRHLAAAINPIISELHSHNTIEEVADLLENLGVAAYVNEAEADGSTSKRLHHQLSTVLASALRYEVSQAAEACR